MIAKSANKDCRSNRKSPNDCIVIETKRRRGRPKGSKNKTKETKLVSLPAASNTAPKKRGRPKGSKNKSKIPAEASVIPHKKRGRKPKEDTQVQTVGEHPLFTAAVWLEKHMSSMELQYYNSRANKLELTRKNVMALDILSIFNIQDTEIRKQIKSYKQ